MFELSIQSSARTYPILIGNGALSNLRGRDVVIIVDSKLGHIAKEVGTSIIEIEASEDRKNLATCELVIEQMKSLGCNRDTIVVAIGGGFVQDIATLVCALYMRGISWTYVPTTLMAMMDSCIGGKSSINVGSSKNLIGNFYPPVEIVIDPALLNSLDATAIASGLAEGVKICYARGPLAFEKFCTYRATTESYDSELSSEWITHVLRAKKWFVETDEFDQGPRKLLNFGHTFGHALESATEFEIPHGIAICIGVLAALRHPLSNSGELEKKLKQECLAILAPIAVSLSPAILNFDRVKFEKAFQGDKKHSKQHFRLVLSQQGTLRIIELERNESEIAIVLEVMERALEMVLGE